MMYISFSQMNARKPFREVSLGTVLEQGLQAPEREEHKSVLLRGNCDLWRANVAF